MIRELETERARRGRRHFEREREKMSNENDLRSRLVPAICTQCGGQVQVDPSQEAAVCQYCGTPFNPII